MPPGTGPTWLQGRAANDDESVRRLRCLGGVHRFRATAFRAEGTHLQTSGSNDARLAHSWRHIARRRPWTQTRVAYPHVKSNAADAHAEIHDIGSRFQDCGADARIEADKAGPSTTSPSLTPVQQKLLKNTNLANKLQSRLPAGTDLMKASEGFKNLGQFVAAANVSHNLGIPFDRLKTSMVDDGASLGQSIQTLKKSANADLEAQRAVREANTMVSEAETVSPSKTPKSATTNHAPRQ